MSAKAYPKLVMRLSKRLRACHSARGPSGRSYKPRLELLEDRRLLSPGDLDPSFGMGGTVTTDFQGTLDSQGEAAALQPDGKIVMVGKISNGFASGIRLVRYDVDGRLDLTFGNGGLVSSSMLSDAHAVVVQSDYRIVVGGLIGSEPNVDGALARYNADGSPDISFGASGIVISHINAGPNGIALQSDGKLIVAGGAMLARYNADGTLDTTFGGEGKVSRATGTITGVTIQPDGKVIAVGGVWDAAVPAIVFLVARYNPDGTVDVSFGSGGVVTTEFSGPFITQAQDEAKAVFIQPDGKIVVGGTQQSTIDAFFDLARYNSDGSLDVTFGSGGKVTESAFEDELIGLVLQGDGKIMAAGSDFGLTVARFTPTGALDPTFGTHGFFTPPNVMTSLMSLLVQSTGRIIIAGSGVSAGDTQHRLFAMDGFTTAGNLDTTFGMSGGVTTSFTGTVGASVSSLLLQPDGKIVVAGSAGVGTSVFAVLTRYNTDGTLDPAFGMGGKVTTVFAGSGSSTIIGALLQHDRKILVTGFDVLARYKPDGSLDASFGMAGTGIVTFGGVSRLLALQPDGKIVVAFVAFSISGVETTSLVRFNPDGSQDGGFLANLPTLIANTKSADLSGLAIQDDGKILVSSSASDVSGAINKYALTRLDPDGSPDPTFGTSGSIMTDFSGTVRVQIDGRIVVAGKDPTPSSEQHVRLARFYPNGNPDTTFGSGGESATNLRPSFNGPTDLLLEPDGKVVVAGRSSATLLAVARFDPNGSIDVSFGTSGVATADLTQRLLLGAVSLALEPDGRIVAAGDADIDQTPEFSLARFLGDNPISDPNQRFVTHIYLDLLERSPDAGGLTSFTAALDQGQFTRSQVLQIITNSPEHHTLEVQGLYGRLLGRPADPSGLDHWVTFLNQGGTAQQLEAIFIGSPEYFSQRGGGTDNGFLQAVYSDVLQRPIDASGAQAWSQVLSKGVTPTVVATAILASPEADQVEVQDLYVQVLHRSADPSGLSSFTNALQQGLTIEQLVAILAGSDEYFARP